MSRGIPNPISPSMLRNAKKMYRTGMSTHSIGRLLKVGQEVVRTSLIAAGVEMRSPAEGQRAAQRLKEKMK